MTNEAVICQALVPALKAAFPDAEIQASEPPNPVAVFPAVCPAVGAVMVFDDGDEATVVIENITHHHVDCYDPDLSDDDRVKWIADDVVGFLRQLFADRVFLWSRNQGKGGGGWRRPFDGGIPDDVPEDADIFVWSGRLERTG